MIKSSTKLFGAITGAFLLALVPMLSIAQVPTTAAGYAFTASSGTYTQLTGGTLVSAIHVDDANVQSISLGFIFPFAGSTYSTVSVSSNGWLSLGNLNPSASISRINTVANLASIVPCIMPLWDDLNGSPNGNASYLTTGSSPNRIFTFEWRNWKWYYTGTGNSVLSYQVKLYEQGRIELIYSQGPDPVNASASATICIAKTASDFQALNNSSTTPTISTSTLYDVIATKPATGQIYAWDIPCTAPSGLAASNVTNNSANFNWNTVSGSQGYEYALTTSATPPVSGTPIATNSYPATGLSPTTTYYMHVRNKCNTNIYSAWVSVSITTLTSCFPVSTVSVSNMTASTGTLNWSAGAASVGYEYVINQSAGNPAGNGTSTSATSVPFTGLTGGTNYYAHVRNVCAGNDKSSWTHYAFTTPVCNKPTNVLISNISDTAADLLWSQMVNANGYEYAVDFSNQNPTTGIQSTTGITTHVGQLIPNSKYYIHIRSKCFISDNSDWRLDSFITKMNCYPPQLQVNNLGTNSPYAFWAPIPTAISYEHALTNSVNPPAFGATIYVTNVSMTLPVDGKDYYLHVRSKCNSQFTFSVWSTVALRTGSTSIYSYTPGNEKPELYPNPVKETLFLKLSSRTQGQFDIVDVTGRVLLQNKIQSAITEINTATLPAGMYLLRFRSDKDEQVLRFMKQ